MNRKRWNWVACVGLLASGCGGETSQGGPKILEGEPVFAVQLRSDDAAGVALLDGAGQLLDGRFIDSGSVAPKLSALFTDIALPTYPERGVLTIIARSPNDAILRVSLDNGKILSEFSTQEQSNGAAYSSNPQDYLLIDEHTAWVSRYEPNLDPNAKSMNKGDDLVKLDPTTGKLLQRVSLDQFHKTIHYVITDSATGAMTPATGTAYARPGSLIRARGHVLVGLDRLTADFNGQAGGALAVLDLETKEVSGFDLKGLGNCGTMIPVLGRDDAAIVSCVGVPWGSADTSGLVLVSVDEAGKVTEEQRFVPGDGPLSVFFPISLGGTDVVVAESGWATGGKDKLFRLDLETGKLKRFFTADASGVIGFNGVYRPSTSLLLVGDRTDGATGVRRFTMEPKIEQLDMIELDPSLPVDSIHPLVEF